MDDKRFDALAKRVGTSRRSVLKKMVGLGGASAIAWMGMSEAEAARRGQSGKPQLTSTRICTLTYPSCCMTCDLLPWVDASDIGNKLSDCFKQGYDPKVCSTCRDDISVWVLPEGICY